MKCVDIQFCISLSSIVLPLFREILINEYFYKLKIIPTPQKG